MFLGRIVVELLVAEDYSRSDKLDKGHVIVPFCCGRRMLFVHTHGSFINIKQ